MSLESTVTCPHCQTPLDVPAQEITELALQSPQQAPRATAATSGEGWMLLPLLAMAFILWFAAGNDGDGYDSGSNSTTEQREVIDTIACDLADTMLTDSDDSGARDQALEMARKHC